MSYSFRNTLLLAVTLILILSVTGSWIYFKEYSVLQENKDINDRQQTQLVGLEREAARFSESLALNEELTFKNENYPKTLFPSSRLPRLYDYMRKIDRGSVFLNFNFTDSTQTGQTGKVRFYVDGLSDFRQLRNFVYSLEESAPLVRITELQLRPTMSMENLNEVTFRMGVEAHYSRDGAYPVLQEATLVNVSRQYNPFFPLVHDIVSNEENRTDVERSRLAAISDDTVFLYDQNNNLLRLRLRDSVYLGFLESISPDNREATFFLNKGGIVERKTLRLMQ